MIKEDYVSFEIAKLLKEKGFDECPLYRYDDCGQIWVQGGYDKTIKWHFPAPTLQMTMKWLREVHNIVCNIDIESRNFYYYSIFIIRSSIEAQYQLTSQKPYFETYEEACEAAIKYCLENLI